MTTSLSKPSSQPINRSPLQNKSLKNLWKGKKKERNHVLLIFFKKTNILSRYRVPSAVRKSFSDAEYANKIQLRVGVAIQQWIKSPFFDLSEGICSTLEDFAHTMVADGHTRLGETLLQDLKKKVKPFTQPNTFCTNDLISF